MNWPTTGRGSRAGDPPTTAQAKAIYFVYQMNGGPVGDGVTRAEIREEVPEITQDELADCLRAEWLKVDYWGIIGGEVSEDAIPDCWATLPGGDAFLKAESDKRLVGHDHVWGEAETSERFNPPWESCRICHAWRTGPDQPTHSPELYYQLEAVYGRKAA